MGEVGTASKASASKTGLAIVFTMASIVTGLIAMLPSCNGPPSKTCFADRVNALGVDEDAGPDRVCTTCLQTKNAPNACCDAVGACDEDPEKLCVPSFQAAHRCVIEGGASEESRCRGFLTNDRAKTLYACMRSNCGSECRVPSCDLDPDVGVLVNRACDGCMGGRCCEKINECYRDRRCRNVVECIVQKCPRTLGPSMTALGAAGPEAIERVRQGVCSGESVPGDTGPGPCLQRCLDDFAPGGDEGTTDDQNARCLAFDVYACGAQAGCGPKCEPPSDPDEPWPEDNPAPGGVGDGGAGGDASRD